MSKVNESNRIDWIDTAKGITMLLVIFAHMYITSTSYGYIRAAIFTFHMPLFFVLSSCTFKLSIDNNQFVEKTERAFKHLVIPAIVLFLLSTFQTGYSLITQGNVINLQFVVERINMLIYSSGLAVNVMGSSIPSIGIPWFLIVLFLGRTLFDYMHLKLSQIKFVIATCVCTVIGVLHAKTQWLPFSFDIALAIQIFFLFGMYLKKFNMNKRTILRCFIFFILWISAVLIGDFLKLDFLELACRRYPLFPLCILIAILGTMFISYISVLLSKCFKFLKYIGKNSMYLLWIHALDSYFSFLWNPTQNIYIYGLTRVLCDVFFFLVLMNVMFFIRKLKNKIITTEDKQTLDE